MIVTLSCLLIILLLALCLLLFAFKPISKRSFFICSVFSLFALALYARLGAFHDYQLYLERKKKRQRAEAVLKSFKSTTDVIAKLKIAVNQQPKNPRGWFLLGKLELSEGNTLDALKAFSKAYQLDKQNFKTTFLYMETLYISANETKTPAVTDLIKQLQRLNSQSIELKLFLMQDAYLHGNDKHTKKYARELLAKLPQDSKLYNDIQSLLIVIDKKHRGEKHG